MYLFIVTDDTEVSFEQTKGQIIDTIYYLQEKTYANECNTLARLCPF